MTLGVGSPEIARAPVAANRQGSYMGNIDRDQGIEENCKGPLYSILGPFVDETLKPLWHH
jgi:hypothetical protein